MHLDGGFAECVEGWATASTETLSRFIGAEDASILVEFLVSEAVGRMLDDRMDATAGSPGAGADAAPGDAPSYSELMDFLEQFWDAASLGRERGPLSYSRLPLARLRELQRSLCARIVIEYPTTFGRFGREILARDWRNILTNLPRFAEAKARLERIEGGKEAHARCRRTLEDVLDDPAFDTGTTGLLRFRTLFREILARVRALPQQSH